MRVSVIGPNLRDQSKGSFHVHAEGCADIGRDPNYIGNDPWTFEADSRADVGEAIYGDHIDEGSMTIEESVEDCHFAPCCDELPDHSGKGGSDSPDPEDWTVGELEAGWATIRDGVIVDVYPTRELADAYVQGVTMRATAKTANGKDLERHERDRAAREQAETLARVTGSIGATVETVTRDPETGEDVVISSGTYRRLTAQQLATMSTLRHYAGGGQWSKLRDDGTAEVGQGHRAVIVERDGRIRHPNAR